MRRCYAVAMVNIILTMDVE